MSEFKPGRYRVAENPQFRVAGGGTRDDDGWTAGEVVTVESTELTGRGNVWAYNAAGVANTIAPESLVPLSEDSPAPPTDIPPSLVGLPLARSVALGVARDIFGADAEPYRLIQFADYILKGATK